MGRVFLDVVLPVALVAIAGGIVGNWRKIMLAPVSALVQSYGQTQQGLAAMESGSPMLLRISPVPEPEQSGKTVVHNPCLSGGTLEIFMEPVLPAPCVAVVGDTPIARALATVGAALGYEIADWSLSQMRTTDAVVVATHGFDEEGYFRTGDLGIVDADGYVTITGRLKDVIIRKGENISAKEVEDLLFTHPAVADVAVIGLPDPASGERACAVIVVEEGHDAPTLEDVFAFCKEGGLMTMKIPEQVEILPVLPRNPTGKVLKHELRKQYAE